MPHRHRLEIAPPIEIGNKPRLSWPHPSPSCVCAFDAGQSIATKCASQNVRLPLGGVAISNEKSTSIYKCERGSDFDWGSCAHRSPLPFHPSWSATPMLNHLINIAETASPSSQNSIAAAFFLRSSFG